MEHIYMCCMCLFRCDFLFECAYCSMRCSKMRNGAVYYTFRIAANLILKIPGVRIQETHYRSAVRVSLTYIPIYCMNELIIIFPMYHISYRYKSLTITLSGIPTYWFNIYTFHMYINILFYCRHVCLVFRLCKYIIIYLALVYAFAVGYWFFLVGVPQTTRRGRFLRGLATEYHVNDMFKIDKVCVVPNSCV